MKSPISTLFGHTYEGLGNDCSPRVKRFLLRMFGREIREMLFQALVRWRVPMDDYQLKHYSGLSKELMRNMREANGLQGDKK